MADGWFPRFSPSGRHLMRGSVSLSVDGTVIAGDAISGAWLSEDVILYRQHSTGKLRRLASGLDEDFGPVCHQVVAGGGGWAIWHEQGEGAAKTPFVFCSDGRRFLGFGGGMWPLAMSPGGILVMGRHRDGVLCIVYPYSTIPVALAEGRMPRCGGRSVVWEYGTGRISHANLDSRLPLDVTVPGEQCYGPVLVDAPGEEWVLTHTASERLLLFSVGSHEGYVVAEGVTDYPDAAWTPAGVRVAWSRQGEPMEALVDLSQPRVSLVRQPPVWHPVGTGVDTLPFVVPDYTGTLRSADGQTLQTVRTGPREVCCLKGSPERQERWQWDDTAVYLTYDASDGRDGRPWRVTPTPVWCRRVAQVGEAVAAPDAVLVRRTLTGGSEAHPFPVRTTVAALGEHIDLGALGRCRVLVTTWEPGWPTSGYAEHHWWAIRESDGLRWGRVRYEERHSGEVDRAFDFNQPLPDVQLVPAPPLAIPDPPAPSPEPEPEPMPVTFPPRDQTLDFLAVLETRYRDQMQRPARETHVDAEGTAVWLESYLRYRVGGASHEVAVSAVMRDIDQALGIAPVPPSGGLVGALRVA